ncbi:histidine kinase [Kibdelosporangium lantanae]
MRTTEESLKLQSLLVAGVCVAADGLGVALYGLNGPLCWIALVATVVADCALAAPARFSGWVCGLQAVVRVSVLFLHAASPANQAGMLIASYRAGAWLRGLPAIASLVVMAIAGAVPQLLFGTHPQYTVVVVLEVAILPWLVGRYTTARRAYLAHLEQRDELERRDAQEAVDKAIAEDRSAIARDLHDVIVHHVSAIGLHAGAARLSLPTDNQRLEESLRAVETSSRAAMVDLRHLLDLLHGDNSDSASQPGLDNLEELFDGVRAAGVPAKLSVSGAPRDVPESLDITLYRIVQEMLTNALRHGDLSGVEVALDYEPASISLSASNPIGSANGHAPAPRRGLVGIRNRASMFHGKTVSGPDPDGHVWRTTVTFPLEEAR